MREVLGAALVGLCASSAALGESDVSEEQSGAAREGVAKQISGSCHCGHVRYEAQGPIVKASYCDCRGCQKATGTLKAPFVTVRRPAFKVTAGKPSRFRADSGVKCDAHGEWHFCPKCGTQVFWKGDKGKEVDIFAGTLDDPAVFKPKK